MMCHECARGSTEVPGLGQCRFCLVSLCKDHLVGSGQSAAVPQYGCEHHPERPFTSEESREVGRPVRLSPSPLGA